MSTILDLTRGKELDQVMDFERDGIKVQVAAADLPDDALRAIATEVAEVANERDLDLRVPAFAGGTAVEATTEAPIDPTEAKEAVTGQLETAFSGYQTVVEQLNDGRRKKERVDVADQETVATELDGAPRLS